LASTPRATNRRRPMEPFIDHAAQVLARSPAPALPVDELLRVLLADAPGSIVREEVLIHALQAQPDRFRLVRAIHSGQSLQGVLGESATLTAGARLSRGPWVIGLGPEQTADRGRLLARLRASLVYLGRRLDEGSASAMVRWLALLAECRRVGDRIRQAAS